MNRNEFFPLLPAMDAQFGNLILARDKADRAEVAGIQECFLSSVIQFQPLARLRVFDADGLPVRLLPVSASSDPVLSRKTFEGGGLRLAQELVVSGDEASLLVSIGRIGAGDSGQGFTLVMDGACLFSPQGVPYHWRDESLLTMHRSDKGRIGGEWSHGGLPFKLASSIPFTRLDIRKVADDDIVRTHYFTSFNLKKRHTYWVEARPDSLAAGTRPGESVDPKADSSQSVTSRTIGYEAVMDLDSLENACTIVFGFACGAGASAGAGARTDADAGAGAGGGVDAGAGSALAERHANLILRENGEWDSFLAGIPGFHAADRALERMYYTSWFVLKSNRVRFDDPRFPYAFTSVNKHHYYNQFFWDSAYQAIAWLWYNKAEPAQDELRNFVTNQWRNGMIPYELFMYPVNGREWMDGDGTSTGMTQPPVIGIALPEIYRKFGNREYLEFFYDALLRYEKWLSLYRDLGKRGLSCYLNIWETGMDNSPRLDACARNRVLDPAIESADFNAYIHCMRKTIMDTAKILGLEAPPEIGERMAMTKKSMNTLMYDPEDGFYHDVVAGTEERIPVKTTAGLIPLATDIPDDETRARIVRDYIDSEKEFMSGCPVPSVSRSEKSYNPVDFWRGANWPQITWTVIFALAQDEPGTAGKILGRFLETTKSNPTCYEYYDAETGEGVGMPFQGWGALYTDMIMRFVAGIIPDDAGMRFKPLPSGSGDFSVSGVKLKDLELSLRHAGNAWSFDFSGHGGFEMEGNHPFHALPAGQDSTIRIEFEQGCDPAKVRLTGANPRIALVFG